jgi:hypothetical protein
MKQETWPLIQHQNPMDIVVLNVISASICIIIIIIIIRWLKSIDDNLKSQPKQFWKYVASFRRRNSTPIQLEVGGAHLAEPYKVADAFAKHFQSVYNIPCSGVFPFPSKSSECLSLALSPNWTFVKTI